MAGFPNFTIRPTGEISDAFLDREISDFRGASRFIANLPYARNANKEDLKTVFSDQCGTCSTKHALLKKLTDENRFDEIKLMLGIFKMNGVNTPKIAETLKQNQLDYIPEAHNYLKYQGVILDFTKANASASDFEADLLEEIEINPNQITDFKVDFHKKYLQNWLTENPEIPYDLEALWKIREACIEALSK